jgi:SAM-dependent methyltransferase
MGAFVDYARYYDLIYGDKNYAAEAEFVAGQLRAFDCRPQELLDLGCGTGRHASEFARMGLSVLGVDASERMIGIARDRLKSPRLKFECGNIQTWRNATRFDAVVSLFHVMSYQLEYAELGAAVETAHVHLKPGGIFLFDFWYGPAVLTTPPEVRVKRIDGGDIEVTRIANPCHRPNDNSVVIDYTVLVMDKKARTCSEFHEQHAVRYWFLPELRMMLEKGGFQLEHSGRWQSAEPLSADSWYGYLVARKG